MNEIKIFYNQEKTREVRNPISFDPVQAGEVTKKSLFFLNNIKFPINLEIDLVGNIDIKKSISNLKPDELKEIVFEFSPKMTAMEPIKAKLIVNIDYIVK